MGKCPQCGQWNTLVEELLIEEKLPLQHSREIQPIPYDAIEAIDVSRKKSSIGELDRVLGGGVVDGSLVLVGGDPGVGKSTIMLQMAHNLSLKGMNVLYVSGEESALQLKIRGDRLGVSGNSILIYPEVMLEHVKEQILSRSPEIVIIDSIQSIFSHQIDSPPGSVSQIRYCAGVFMEIAKTKNKPVFLTGHVTKDGWIAGPKMLEHMVDTVLYFEGHTTGAFRVLRAVKNRFGPTGEIGVFEMKDSGLEEIEDPSGIFVHGNGEEIPGSSVAATIEGSRAFLVEVQSLVSKTSFSMPKRISIGIDATKLSVLLAVMEKRSGIFISSSDVVVNVAGGIKVGEPAVDLATFLAVASSALERPVPKGVVCIGEIGLNGELRPVTHMETRIKESRRMGFSQILLPKANQESLPRFKGIKLKGLSALRDALSIFES